ncbi:hypothetical protein TDB9533_02902 [Thalassocella blandensis]|nr:hypothetical protein TDB9533_02902 [Thalassocella blandensis]
MEKQLLIYSKVAPLSKVVHKNTSVRAVKNFSFAKNINSVPLTAAEFPFCASEFCIVFTGKKENITPALILGIQEGENAYIREDGTMQSKYIPAFLRRYPFVFSTDEEAKSFTLCVDEEFEGLNEDGEGERFFDDEGEQTTYLKNVLNFIQEYQHQFNRTRMFCKKLKELDLLSPMEAVINTKEGKTSKLTGFLTVNREKLSQLSDENLLSLTKSGELELIYLHLHSIRNFKAIASDMLARQSSDKTTPNELH